MRSGTGRAVARSAGPVDHLVARRLEAQLLAGPAATSVVQVVQRLLAVQAQDPRGFRLAIRARSAGLTAADVDRALTVDRSVVVSWLNRGTLHLVRAEDFGWLHALTTPQLATGVRRRLEQEQVPPDAVERGIAAIVDAITTEGPLSRTALRPRIAAAGVRTEGQALVHVLYAATVRGLVVRGPVVDGEHAFVLTRDWLGPLGEPWTGERDEALTRLAGRYLAGHGPAGERDLARWSGLGLRDVRRGLAALGSAVRPAGDGLVELADGPGGPGPALEPSATGPRTPAEPRLLGAFDPLLLGWVDRTPVLDGHVELVTDNGIFHPFALVDGHAVGRWSMPGGVVTLSPFEPLPAGVADRLAADGADVTRFLGRRTRRDPSTS